MMNPDMPSKSEKKEQTPKGNPVPEAALGKGESTVKPPKKSEAPNATPKGMSAKGSKDQGKDAQTGHTGKGGMGANANGSEAPEDAPSGVNDMEVPHVHLPELLHQKEGDDVHLHVYGKIKSHDMNKGKNHAVVEVTKVHRDGETNEGRPVDKTRLATAPMDELKQVIKSQTKEG